VAIKVALKNKYPPILVLPLPVIIIKAGVFFMYKGVKVGTFYSTIGR